MAIPEEQRPNYEVDYNDERFQQVQKDNKQLETEINNTYGGMINNADQYYNDLAQNTQDWADKQSQLQQERTDFAIEQIEQQKDKANKDYIKEQSGAYVDWRKQSNQYGTEAEKMASAGLDKTGYSESSQVSMYNTYQNRIATARESYNNAVINYNNAIKDAQLQNNATLAEIAYNALQQQLELSLQGFQYKNQLLLEQANKKIELKNTLWQQQMDILDQMNTENAMKWDIDKYYDTKAWETEQAEINRQHDKDMAEIEHNYAVKRDEINNAFTAKENELDRKHKETLLKLEDDYARKQAEEQHARDLEKLEKQKQNQLAILDQELANEKALYSYQIEQNKAKISGSVGSSAAAEVAKAAGNVGASASKKKSVQVAKTTGKAKPVPIFSTKEQAETYLRKNYDVPNANSLYSFSDWSRRKNANSSSALIKNSLSYGHYLKLHCEYLIDQYAR